MNTKVILLDADVFIHFMKADHQDFLPIIFTDYQLCILDIVYEELSKRDNTKACIDALLAEEKIELRNFPHSNLRILQEFARLLREGKGEGESACMAVARYQKNVIASSNLKDIRKYCKKYKIKYLTTMDFLVKALDSGVLSEEACNSFIRLTKAKGSKLPVKKISDYKQKTDLD